MDNAIIAALARQSGLAREMAVVANNVANIGTAGFRREGIVFAEFVRRAGDEPSLSMAHAAGRHLDLTPGPLERTGGTYDLAIAGEGFFRVEGEGGAFLTRAGAFSPDAENTLVTPDGYRLLDDGGAPVALPVGARDVAIARDGTLTADGQPVARIGVWQPADPGALRQSAGTRFAADAVDPVEDGAILQGHLEGANVSPVAEIARMIEVSRAYEAGQALLDREDQRIRAVIQVLVR